jgi:hypothetical protein
MVILVLAHVWLGHGLTSRQHLRMPIYQPVIYPLGNTGPVNIRITAMSDYK